jgi:hypothetical protein
MHRVCILPLLLIAMATTLGCAENPTAHVSGVVKYKDGSPIKGAVRMVRFEPAENTTATVRKPATGQIQDDGSFELLTLRPGDGVYKGDYNVAFSVLTSPMGGEWLIKEEYQNAETTPYKVTVDGNIDDLVFEIEQK